MNPKTKHPFWSVVKKHTWTRRHTKAANTKTKNQLPANDKNARSQNQLEAVQTRKTFFNEQPLSFSLPKNAV